MRRYAMIQKARDADVIGILVGTLGVGKCESPKGRSVDLIAVHSVLLALDGSFTPAPL